MEAAADIGCLGGEPGGIRSIGRRSAACAASFCEPAFPIVKFWVMRFRLLFQGSQGWLSPVRTIIDAERPAASTAPLEADFPAPAGYHLAQVNLARAVDDLDWPAMAEFMAALDKVNGASRSPGFVGARTIRWPMRVPRKFSAIRATYTLSVWNHGRAGILRGTRCTGGDEQPPQMVCSAGQGLGDVVDTRRHHPGFCRGDGAAEHLRIRPVGTRLWLEEPCRHPRLAVRRPPRSRPYPPPPQRRTRPVWRGCAS